MTATDTMAPDAAPEGYAWACPRCGVTTNKAGAPFETERAMRTHERTCTGVAPEDSGGPVLELTAAEKKLVKDLRQCLATPTLLLMAVNMTDGLLVMNGSEDLCESLVLAARKSPKLKHFLTLVVESVVWLAVGSAVAAIVLPILDNHGILSVPTFRVADKLNADHVVRGTETAPASPSRPAPVVPFRVTGAPGASNGVAADMGAGMNRAARRAVEPPGPSIPPEARAVAAQFGIDESELEKMASQLGLG